MKIHYPDPGGVTVIQAKNYRLTATETEVRSHFVNHATGFVAGMTLGMIAGSCIGLVATAIYAVTTDWCF